MKPKYITKINRVEGLSPTERENLTKVTDKFQFRANEYYLSLIDFKDPKDTIRRIIIPDLDELTDWGTLDASHEEQYTVAPGLQHKYTPTVLLLVNDICGGFCRFCFRKRLFIGGNEEVVRDVSKGLEYIRNHPEITNVLLTGGDPLLLSTPKLGNIVRQIREIDHVKIIRIGSKMPAFYPMRITQDPSLLEMISKYSTKDKKIYMMVHFNHPRELTEESIDSLNMLKRAGALTVNQTPMIKGVNDDPETLAELFRVLSYVGVPPYYIFQCRPVIGNEMYAVEVERAFEVFEEAKSHVSGLAKRSRYIMSHDTGKVEVVGMRDGYTYFKYHQAVNPDDYNRLIMCRSNPKAYWFDDYEPISDGDSWEHETAVRINPDSAD
ncbi:MAG: KamA family radical SAM protein [Deltaproteobacteria bacterium]|uniref:KamA family radical SAM protein n=1 Tax=Candidatus Zymogenus saltonus TaxID=2844893 RepID=A0A9D8KDM2_9DELT|nr:KamA family radical SAM protein [Candidatus Zymogenus saltonus]